MRVQMQTNCTDLLKRDTGGSAAVSRHRERSSRHKISGLPRKPHPQDSRLSSASPPRASACALPHKIPNGDFSTQPTHHAAERIKWSAFGATKTAQLCRGIFNEQ